MTNKNSINKVENYPHLLKDERTGAVINSDNNALYAYKQRRNQMRQIERVASEMDELRADMSEIKKSLEAVVRGLNNV